MHPILKNAPKEVLQSMAVSALELILNLPPWEPETLRPLLRKACDEQLERNSRGLHLTPAARQIIFEVMLDALVEIYGIDIDSLSPEFPEDDDTR